MISVDALSAADVAFGLRDRLVVVTGGASGLGGEVATQLARVGAMVAVLDRSEEGATAKVAELSEISDAGHLAVPVDVSDASEVAAAFAKVEATGAAPVGIFNSAGIREDQELIEIAPEEWERVIGVNLTGTFFCAQAAARLMKESGGSIVNVSSVAGLVAFENRAAYAATKAGVKGITMALARDLACYGIRANAIAPGVVRTPLTKAYFEDPEFARGLRVTVPMARPAEPIEIASVALFLFSDLSSYLTGVTLPVDGGFVASGALDLREGAPAMRLPGFKAE